MINRIIYLVSVLAIITILFALWFTFKNLTVSLAGNWPAYSEHTGHKGDTIGGITAPFLNGIGSILLFITIYIQIQTNEKQSKEAILNKKYESFLHDINLIKEDIGNFQDFTNQYQNGAIALLKFTDRFVVFVPKFNIQDEIFIEFTQLTTIMRTIRSLSVQITDSDIKQEAKALLLKKINTIYYGFLIIHIDTIEAAISRLSSKKPIPLQSFTTLAKKIHNIIKDY